MGTATHFPQYLIWFDVQRLATAVHVVAGFSDYTFQICKDETAPCPDSRVIKAAMGHFGKLQNH